MQSDLCFTTIISFVFSPHVVFKSFLGCHVGVTNSPLSTLFHGSELLVFNHCLKAPYISAFSSRSIKFYTRTFKGFGVIHIVRTHKGGREGSCGRGGGGWGQPPPPPPPPGLLIFRFFSTRDIFIPTTLNINFQSFLLHF